MTSYRVVALVKRLSGERRVGHAGTLDPLATGVLPVAVGQGTKILQFLLAADKSYRATLRLGVSTDTLDSEGEVVARKDLPANCEERLRQVVPDFCGTIEQVPPMYSALKRNGVPLYKLARQGQTVEREARKVKIERLVITAVSLPDVEIEVDCSKGTYIRTLAEDLGEAIGCGGHLTALRRLRSGPFFIHNCISLEDLAAGTTDSMSGLISIECALAEYPAAQLGETAAESLKFGVPPELDGISSMENLATGNLVRLMDGDTLLAMARYAPLRQLERRGDFELVRVFCGS